MILNSSAEGLKKNNADTISTYVNGLIAKNVKMSQFRKSTLRMHLRFL